MQAFEVRRVQLSEDLSRPGDYVFIEKRVPRIQIERTRLPRQPASSKNSGGDSSTL